MPRTMEVVPVRHILLDGDDGPLVLVRDIVIEGLFNEGWWNATNCQNLPQLSLFSLPKSIPNTTGAIDPFAMLP